MLHPRSLSRYLAHLCTGFCMVGLSLATATTVQAQEPAVRNIELQNVDVAPSAVDTKGWLLLNADIRTELEGGVDNLYNFKYDKAERQFRSLRRRYPAHPLPYFMLGLSTWWKILPTNVTVQQFDKPFFAYMDTAVTKAQALYDQDSHNYEACFFLSAAYGFSSRLHAERHDWTRATIEAKRALKYLERSKEANGLSPEFLFGQALFNYYSVWIAEEHPWLKPVLLLFPKGDKQLGLQQLRNVAANAVYTGPESRFFLLKILGSQRENRTAEALEVARKLVQEFPDNAYFQRLYALQCFNEGDFAACEKTSLAILDKYNRGLPGYDGFSGRYASYFLGYIRQNMYKDKDLTRAKSYYQRCIVFSETTEQTSGGYYLFSNLNLARLAAAEKDLPSASRYYKSVLAVADRKSPNYQEAKKYVKSLKKRAGTTRDRDRVLLVQQRQ